jgi:HYDIN/CFA65/VesB family protein/uncharacterized protein DUF1573
LSTGTLDFGSVTAGTSKTLTMTATNTSTVSITVSGASISSPYFSLSAPNLPAAILAGQSIPVSFVFSPNAAGTFNATVSVTSNATNNPASFSLTGSGVTAGGLGSNPTSLNFGTVQTGSSQALSETVTNTGGSTVTISQVGISGTGFTLKGITAPATLAAGQSATFTVTFAPASTTSATGSVTVTSNASNPTLTISLAGTGSTTAGALTAAPVPVAIGSVFTGTSGTATGSLTAAGANVTVSAANSSNSRFAISGLQLPVVIPAGQSAAFTITYSPLVAGADSANLTFTSNAQVATTTDTATATGVLTPVHSVALSWTASTSPNILGFNIYRAVYITSCGGFAKINGSTLNAVTTYTDSAVSDGTNYCYATTAVDSSNAESGYSNIVIVQIPPP